jgi:hypothetical protein
VAGVVSSAESQNRTHGRRPLRAAVASSARGAIYPEKITAFPHTADHLLQLVGQRALKQAVIEVHEEFVQHLVRHITCMMPPSFQTNRMLILVVGESGTGKRVLSHKVMQYTAKEALRAGAKHFVREVATLTGGAGQGSAPPTAQNYFRRDLHVEVKHRDQWFAGQVTKADRANGQ